MYCIRYDGRFVNNANYLSGDFRPFDRSFEMKTGAPVYLLENIAVPVIIYYAQNDGLAKKEVRSDDKSKPNINFILTIYFLGREQTC